MVLIIEVAALLFHYQSLDSAFRLMGFEQRPIKEDPLFGAYLDGFFGDATLSTFGALMFAILIALGLLATMILAPILIEHRLHRVTARTREFVTGLCLLCGADEDEDDDGSQVPARTAAQPQAGSTTEPLFDQAPAAAEPAPENPSPDQETTVEVVGSAAGERVTLDRACRHPDYYWIYPDTHEIWNADYRRQLMGGWRKAKA